MSHPSISRRTALRIIGGGAGIGVVATGTAAGTHETWTATLSGRAVGTAEFKRTADHTVMGFGLELANMNAGSVAQGEPSPDDLRCFLISTASNASVDLHPGNTVNAVLRGGEKLTFIADGAFDSDDVGGDDVDTLDDLVAEMNAEETVVGVTTDQHLALFGTVVPRG